MTTENDSSGSDTSAQPSEGAAEQPPIAPVVAPVDDAAAPTSYAYGPATPIDGGATPAQAAPAPAPAQPAPSVAQPAPPSTQPAPAYTQPAPTYTQPDPASGQPYPVAPSATVGTKGLGLASMVIGIVALVLIWTTYLSVALAVLALIFGIISKRRKELPRGYATTGIVLASVTLGLLAIGYLVLVAFAWALSGGQGFS
jgi:hypothetical protein